MLTEAEKGRLLLLDRLAVRVPELDLDEYAVEWMTLDDGHEALLVDGGGIVPRRTPRDGEQSGLKLLPE
ncbi:MAG: hypothetical protein WKF96_08935 [Solirubrobacteraceae bacterium]